MENEPLILKFKDEEKEFSFENKIELVEDKKLIQNLSKPNIKNQDSSLLIKSLNDTHISDVIEIKINVAETGFVLVSFAKESLNDEARTTLLQNIEKLKNEGQPNKEISIKKMKDLLGILVEFAPIYATFSNTGDIKIEQEEFGEINLNFPFLILAQPKRKMVFKVEKKVKEPKLPKQQKEAPNKEKTGKPQKVKEPKVKKVYPSFPLFDSDYMFVAFFSLLGSFSITASVFELMNKKGVATFLIILSVILALTLLVAVTSIIYKKGELRNPLLRYYLGAYVILGIVLGIVSSFFVCKGFLKTEIEDFNYKRMTLISSLISASLLLTLSLSRLVNLIKKLILKKKSH